MGWWCVHVSNGSSLCQLHRGGEVLQGWRWWLLCLAVWARKATLAPSTLPRQRHLPPVFPIQVRDVGCSPCWRRAALSIRSWSDGLLSSRALDVTLHDGAEEQSSTALRGGCAAKSGNCPSCNASCSSVLLGWPPAQALV